jgi:hypothetical protein
MSKGPFGLASKPIATGQKPLPRHFRSINDMFVPVRQSVGSYSGWQILPFDTAGQIAERNTFIVTG